MTVQLCLTTIMSMFVACYGWEYSIKWWNKCHENSYVELYNRPINTCMLECALRDSCIAVQYERIKRTCGILTLRQVQAPLKTCKKFIYIKRSDMNIEPESCAPYKTLSIDGKCITECALPENLRINSTWLGFPSAESKIKLTCTPPLVQDGDQSILCNEDGQFSSIPVCNAPCPDGWVFFDDSCYYIDASSINFTSAQIFCEGFGGKLVEIETPVEDAFIRNSLQIAQGTAFWIGITDEEEENVWKMADSLETVTYLNWGENQPNNGRVSNCGAIWESFLYKWVDEPCHSLYQPVCEKAPRSAG